MKKRYFCLIITILLTGCSQQDGADIAYWTDASYKSSLDYVMEQENMLASELEHVNKMAAYIANTPSSSTRVPGDSTRNTSHTPGDPMTLAGLSTDERVELLLGVSDKPKTMGEYTEAQALANIEDVHIEVRSGSVLNPDTRTITIKIHGALTESVKAIYKEIYADTTNPVTNDNGGYFYRQKNNGTNENRAYEDKIISNHSFGCAIDINIDQNLYGDKNSGSHVPGNGLSLTKDSVIVQTFEKYGWKWGGDWSTPDCMHFEYLPD